MRVERLFPWSDEADRGLRDALGGDRDAIVAGVNSRELECYRLFGGEAYMVTRTVAGELTCCCYQGGRLIEACEWIRGQCRTRGIRSLRFHTNRPGLQRLLRRAVNFRLTEYVFRGEVV